VAEAEALKLGCRGAADVVVKNALIESASRRGLTVLSFFFTELSWRSERAVRCGLSKAIGMGRTAKAART
jgi:hypothetical protein